MSVFSSIMNSNSAFFDFSLVAFLLTFSFPTMWFICKHFASLMSALYLLESTINMLSPLIIMLSSSVSGGCWSVCSCSSIFSDCQNELVSLSSVLFTSFLFSNDLFTSDWFFYAHFLLRCCQCVIWFCFCCVLIGRGIMILISSSIYRVRLIW